MEILKELSDKITEVDDLELAEELTEIFGDLTKRINEDYVQYMTLVKKLAMCEKEQDEERQAKEQAEGRVRSYKEACKVAREIIHKEMELRERAEGEREQAEYDKEYFAREPARS